MEKKKKATLDSRVSIYRAREPVSRDFLFKADPAAASMGKGDVQRDVFKK